MRAKGHKCTVARVHRSATLFSGHFVTVPRSQPRTCFTTCSFHTGMAQHWPADEGVAPGAGTNENVVSQACQPQGYHDTIHGGERHTHAHTHTHTGA